MIDHSILPECFADTVFIQVLGYRNARHQDSKGEVARAMQQHYQKRLAIGVIDRDKPARGLDPKYFSEFKVIKTHDLTVLKHLPGTKHYLIELAPALEKWVFQAAEDCNVDPSQYGFRSLKSFIAVTKSPSIGRNENFRQFINAVKQKNPPQVAAIQSWLAAHRK